MADLIRMNDPAIVALRCTPDLIAAAGDALGMDIPRTVNRFVAGHRTTIAMVGPDDWLVIGDDPDAGPLVAALEAALSTRGAAVCDVSGTRVRFALTGRDALEALARGCSLDLERMEPGQCAATIVARAQAYLFVHADGVYELYPRRSFARYLEDWYRDLITRP